MQIGTCCHPNMKEEGDKMERNTMYQNIGIIHANWYMVVPQ